MKILIRQFLGKSHSWSCVGWGIAKALISQNHQVDLFSTDGIKNLPKELHSNLLGYVEENKPETVYGKYPQEEYDCQISYTCMKNFPLLLSNGKKNRFGIWCYEWAGKNVLPTGFAKQYKYCDKILAPSNFAKQVFLDSGIPEDYIKVISHGITASDYRKTDKISFSTKKNYKLLANIAQPHIRKNIPGLLEVYGKAFTDKDDVVLILKVGKNSSIKFDFEISFNECLRDFYRKFPKHGEIKMHSDFIDDISTLYRSVDTVITLSHCEGYYFPGLEALAAGKSVIAPNWGGQLDFLNKDNALLIEGKETLADPRSMYWETKNNAVWFKPNITDAVEKMRYAYQNYHSLNEKNLSNREDILTKYDWSNISSQIIELC